MVLLDPKICRDLWTVSCCVCLCNMCAELSEGPAYWLSKGAVDGADMADGSPP